ncbi:MAG: hypothetical protein KUG81_10325 [Gammaproteobacteria bacterium]|nr:hypothetical protein [Gammaproteobacteria bacterium]
MSTIGKRLIFIGPADGSNHKPLNVEGLAVAATAPGSIVGESAAGLTKVTDATGDFTVQFLVADKDQQRSKSVDDDWTISENMVAIAPRSGEFVNCLVITAQAVVVGVPLARSATAGALKLAATDGTDEIVGYGAETVTTTATQLVSVRVA